MNTALSQLRRFVADQSWGYQAHGPNASEPAALASLALTDGGFANEARPLVDWLAQLQSPDGSVGVTQDQQRPAWPTSLSMLAWLAYERGLGNADYETPRAQALRWTLQAKGRTFPPRPQISHDTTILGWSWADDTHAWIEPTCFFVLALQAMGESEHPRTREGVRMIRNRLHERGGCNYGNTVVLGQSTLAHLQPTGIAMLALAHESAQEPKIVRSLEFLSQELSTTTATASLCYALLGLTAHNRRPATAETMLNNALKREAEQGTSCYKLALLSLATIDNRQWLPQAPTAATAY